MADDTRYYLKINAIAGSVTTKPYQGWIEIGSYYFGGFSGRPARESDMWALHFTTSDDRAGARLQIAEARDEHLTGLVLVAVRSDGREIARNEIADGIVSHAQFGFDSEGRLIMTCVFDFERKNLRLGVPEIKGGKTR